jgi:hypothetical protein
MFDFENCKDYTQGRRPPGRHIAPGPRYSTSEKPLYDYADQGLAVTLLTCPRLVRRYQEIGIGPDKALVQNPSRRYRIPACVLKAMQ